MSTAVLLLDAAWRIDRVIGAEHACELVVMNRVVAASDEIATVMHSPSVTIEIPSVVARVGLLHPCELRPPAYSARRVRLRDAHMCQFVIDGMACSRRGDSVDHLLPRSLGGGDHWLNAVAACRTHNGAKANRTLEQMHRHHGWALRRDPYIPSRSALVAVITRGEDTIPPRGSTVVKPGDHLFVLVPRSMRADLEDVFSRWRRRV